MTDKESVKQGNTSEASKAFRRKIDEMIKSFANTNGRQPTKLLVDPVTECEFGVLLEEDAYDGREETRNLSQEIFIHGPRKAIQAIGNKWCGLEIVWDAKSFEVC